MSRRKSTFKDRCFQALAMIVLILSTFALIGEGADWLARLAGR